MRRLQRHIIATASSCGHYSIRSTLSFLSCFRRESSERASRYRHQRCPVRERDRPLSSATRSCPPSPGRSGCAAAEACGIQASGAATVDVDVDVTVTCSSLMSELQRVFPWSAAYCLWQQQRRRTSAPSAKSTLSSAAAQGEGCALSKPFTPDEGYDWRHLFLVRYEPHPALLPATPEIQKDAAEQGCNRSAPAAQRGVAGRGNSERRRRSGSGRRSQVDIRGAPPSMATAAAAESTCASRALQLWRQVLLSSSSSYTVASCPACKSQEGDSSHAAPKGAVHASMAGRRCANEGTRTPVAWPMGSSTTLCTGGGARTKQSAAPLPPSLFAWSTPPTYEVYHLSEYAHHPGSSSASHTHASSLQVTEATETSLEQQRRRSSIVRRLRRVGRLHAIPGLPQLPPLLLSRERELSSEETFDGAVGRVESTRQRSARVAQVGADEAGTLQVMTIADKACGIEGDADTSVEREDVLSGTVCCLHDYCHFLIGGVRWEGHLEEGDATDGMDGAEYLLPLKGQRTEGSPALTDRDAHVPDSASERVCSAAGVSRFTSADVAAAAPSPLPTANAAAPATVWRFAPPLSRASGQTSRGVGLTNVPERWRVRADDGRGKADLSELVQQRQKLCVTDGVATAGICPRHFYEDVGHHHWNRINLHAFMDEMARVRHRFHEPSRTTAAAASVSSPVPGQRVHVAAPVPKHQQRAARARHERATPTTAARGPPLSSAPCATSSLMVSDASEAGCSTEALSASHGVGVLLAHQHEWISFSVLFHAHAVQLPDTSIKSAAGLASDRSLDLSHLYCFPHPPCRLSTEELEEWAHAARRRWSECERVHKRCCDRRWRPDNRSEREEGVGDRSPHVLPSLPLIHCMTGRGQSTARRLDRRTESCHRERRTASEPSAHLPASAAPPMPFPRTWLVYVHPDVSLQTVPRLWTCVFGEDAPSSAVEGTEGARGACNTTREADGGREEAGRGGYGDEAEHGHVRPSYFHAAVARKRRRQAGEVEILCRYLLLTMLPVSNVSAAFCGHQAHASVRARARSRGRLVAEAPTKATAGAAFLAPSMAASPASAAAPQRLPASATAVPHEEEHRLVQLRALDCTLAVSPLPRSADLLKRRQWLTKPFVLAEEMRYGRVVKYRRAELVVPRVW
ncbi:hypothetical protein GH5_08437 [Leishmania sp. Ghana 2012 LV757]|uniref:hypothetical protein n=1 Tax=Leishmania sp. Ghana 2012 LV757 TaxID=2803181 RepID=UPI001B61B750|nr:hypothetical protein GH5_08437 [Leishmania sp. Ghana 2012 LV757]